jgi:hypothetical protein
MVPGAAVVWWLETVYRPATFWRLMRRPRVRRAAEDEAWSRPNSPGDGGAWPEGAARSLLLREWTTETTAALFRKSRSRTVPRPVGTRRGSRADT